ncbi:hypothetical protein GCM10015536_42210 [Streptomyces griseomycini]|nr:hypothetical protein GCM10015536_42210 [Streptomyces griseomycini]
MGPPYRRLAAAQKPKTRARRRGTTTRAALWVRSSKTSGARGRPPADFVSWGLGAA